MNFLVTLLAASSALTYIACTALLVTKRWNVFAGNRWIGVAAVAAFVLARAYPQSILAAVASLVFIAALLSVVRHATNALAAILAAVPFATMLLVVDRPFFPEPAATQFQQATIALLCAPGPIAIAAAVISRRRET